MARIEHQLAALATMSPAQLRDEWRHRCDGPPPALPPELLRKLIAHAIQQKRFGGLPTAVKRELTRIVEGGDATASRPLPAALRPGTRLVRSWQGRTISVLTVDDGFVWEDRPYRSLSQIAKEVTGAHWSGPRFFGVVARG